MRNLLIVFLVIYVSIETFSGEMSSLEPSGSEERSESKHSLNMNENEEDYESSEEEEDSIKNKTSQVDSVDDVIQDFNRKNKSDMVRIRSDMLLTKEQTDELYGDIQEEQGSRVKRQAYAGRSYPNNLWPDNKVYFGFYPNASEGVKRVIRKAAGEWAKETCLEFEEVKLDAVKVPNVIGVYSSPDCFSRLGKIGGIQGLSLASSCETVGDAAHELGHALGFLHTHMRHDRDEFIRVNWRNIRRGWHIQFQKQNNITNNNYNITYDYGSVMQYPAPSESINDENTMEPHDRKYVQTLGSHMISFYDKLMMNKHYNCLDKCKGKKKWWQRATAECQNGGFPNPKDCTTCVCPSGYGGRLCNERPKGCGKTLLARTILQTLEDTVGYGSGSINKKDEYQMCNYWIQGLPGSTIEVRLTSYDVNRGIVDEGCRESGIEIKTGSDTGLTGYRFCLPGYERVTLESTSHVVPVITYSATGNKDSVLTYRITSFDPKFKCEDSFLCPAMKKLKICDSKQFFDKMKRKFCSKSCGFCM